MSDRVSLDLIIIEHFVSGKLEQEVAAWAAQTASGTFTRLFLSPSLSYFSSSEAPECVSRLLTDVRCSLGSLRLSSCLSRARAHFSNFL